MAHCAALSCPALFLPFWHCPFWNKIVVQFRLIHRLATSIKSDHHRRSLYLPEWAQMRSAESTLAKLILAVRFCRKLDAIWDQLSRAQKTKNGLNRHYRFARAILFCLTYCCGNNLAQFQTGKENPFITTCFPVNALKIMSFGGKICHLSHPSDLQYSR